MKKVAIIFTILIYSLLCNNYFSSAQCLARAVIKDCKNNFKRPYGCTGVWMCEFVFDKKTKIIEGHFVAIEDEKYQLVFCSAYSEEPVNITIYDNKITAKKSTKVFDNTKTKDVNLLKFEPTKSGDYYIYYKLPPSLSGKPKSGCIMLLIGTETDTGGE